jgi:hypothetical protein
MKQILDWLIANKNTILMNVASAFWVLYGVINTVWYPNGTLPQPWQNILVSASLILTALGYGSQAATKVNTTIKNFRAKKAKEVAKKVRGIKK